MALAHLPDAAEVVDEPTESSTSPNDEDDDRMSISSTPPPISFESEPDQQTVEDDTEKSCEGSTAIGDSPLQTYVEQQAQSYDGQQKSEWLTEVLNGRLTLHPAELSGASNDSRLQLLSIPREIRNDILRLVVRNHVLIKLHFWKQVTGINLRSLKTQHCAIEEVYNYGCNIKRDSSDSKEIGCFLDAGHLFLTCKQAYGEARVIFFEANGYLLSGRQWRSPLLQDFSGTMPKFSIAASNSALVKKLECSLCSFQGIQGTSELDRLVLLVCRLLPGLQKLRLVVNIDSNADLKVVEPGQPMDNSAERAALLYTAARITQHHPKLRKAIWDATSGGIDWDGDFEEDGRIPVGFLGVMEYSYYIQLLADGINTYIDNSTSEARFDEEGHKLGSMHIILDSEKIRETFWNDLQGRNVTEFALPDTATSSESSQAML